MSLRPHKINELNNFIGGWYLDDDGICDELIQYHTDSPDKKTGLMSGDAVVNKEAKDSIDVTLPRNPLLKKYVEKLNSVTNEYIAVYPWSTKLVPWGVIEPVAIQYYKPGGGYKIWHFERDNSNETIARRHLVFMTYLNTVDDGGGTAFYHQDLTVKAEKGLTLIWPSEWNFTHKGIVSPSQEKYIITGWFSTFTKEQFDKFAEAYARKKSVV